MAIIHLMSPAKNCSLDRFGTSWPGNIFSMKSVIHAISFSDWMEWKRYRRLNSRETVLPTPRGMKIDGTRGARPQVDVVWLTLKIART